MKIELTCAECGGNRFTLDHAMEDDTQVECEYCGHKIGTLAMLKAQIAAEVLKRSSVRQATSQRPV